MTENQAMNEIKYRLSIMLLLDLLSKQEITDAEFLVLRKRLVRKYKPVIGCLEVKY